MIAAVTAHSTQNSGAASSGAPLCPTWTSVRVHRSASDSQPPKRWTSSKPLWCLARNFGVVVATMKTNSATSAYAKTSTSAGAPSAVARATNAANQSVPDSAPPTCRPPKWYTFASVQRTRSGHVTGAAVAIRNSRLIRR